MPLSAESVDVPANDPVSAPLNVPVNEFELQILQLIKNTQIERSPDILEHIPKSHKQIKRYLKNLRELELIDFTGSSKTGKYILTEKGEKRV